MTTLSDFINPVPEWNRNIWQAGHFWSGRQPSTYRFDPVRSVRPHTGIDLAAPSGSPILAPADGLVTFSGWSNAAAGYVVSIRHQIQLRGQVRFLWSRHCHCLPNGLMPRGRQVDQGQQVALVGSTGASAGAHDHACLFLDVEYPAWQTQRHLMLDPEPVYAPGGYELMQQGHPFPEDVRRVQRRLNIAGYEPALKVDGDYGPATAAAVRWFQEKMKIHVSGEASPITLVFLFGRQATKPELPPTT